MPQCRNHLLFEPDVPLRSDVVALTGVRMAMLVHAGPPCSDRGSARRENARPANSRDRAFYFTCTPRANRSKEWLPAEQPCPVRWQRSDFELLALFTHGAYRDHSRSILCH